MNKLKLAIEISKKAHFNQFDKSGEPYINHPLFVMHNVKTEEAKIVAILHDVVEDTSITLNYLKKCGFNSNIINALDCLTHRKNESYDKYIERLSKNDLAKEVKLVDLKHNMDLRRLKKIHIKDLIRYFKYIRSYKYLLNVCN